MYYPLNDYEPPHIPFPSYLREHAYPYDAKLSIKDEAEKMYRRIRDKSLTDDELFRLVMYGNTELAEFFASMYVPGFEKGGIRRVTSDYELPTAVTKTSRLDAYAELKDGECVIDFEMESRRTGDVLKRTRQYVANITNSFILKGEGYGRMPRTVVVFFIPYDMMGKGRPYYVVRPKDEDGEIVDEDDIRIYVNWRYEGDDGYGKVSHDLRCAEPGEMYYNEIRKRVEKMRCAEPGEMYYNEIRKRVEKIKDREGGARMREDVFYRMRCEGREEGRAEGRAEGRNEERSAFVSVLLKDNSPSDISKKFNIPLVEVERIRRSMKA